MVSRTPGCVLNANKSVIRNRGCLSGIGDKGTQSRHQIDANDSGRTLAGSESRSARGSCCAAS
jgi:hypothetical protein